MQKKNTKYVLPYYLIPIAAGIVIIILGFILPSYGQACTVVGAILVIGAIVFVPELLRKKMQSSALVLEKDFPQKNFSYDMKFTSHNSIFYISAAGKVGVIWRDNPTQLYFVDPKELSNIQTNNGQRMGSTQRVSCEFTLAGEKIKIYTLRVRNGALRMKDSRVVEAVAKADRLCTLLKAAKQSV